jgi:hypothetical protein
MARRGASLAIATLAVAFATLPAHAAGTLKLRVVHCPTTLGVQQPLPPTPRALHVVLSSRYATKLEGYSNGYLTALGPRGWHCRGQVGADGSAVLDVTAGRSGGSVTEPAITVQFADTPGVSADLACSVFPAAQQQLPIQPCPTSRPKRELLLVLASTTLAFEDPPGVRGIGLPSGGSDPANGIASFVPSTASSTGYAQIETCTLAASSHSLCIAILDNVFRAG